MKWTIALSVALLSVVQTAPAIAAARFMHEPCDILRYAVRGELTPEQKATTGCALVKAGWKEIARCDGKKWSYLLQKDDKHMLCTGTDALAGPSEKLCTEYDDDLEAFNEEFDECDPTGGKK